MTDMVEIEPDSRETLPASDHAIAGIPIPKPMRVRLFSFDDWETFVKEWSTALKHEYVNVRQFGGSGDWGVDIAGFSTDDGFHGTWDNYQCKHYDHPLYPSDVWIEIGKVIYYAYSKKYTIPRAYYFVCPRGIGTTLEQYLNTPGTLKTKLIENWGKHCSGGITSTEVVELRGDLLDYYESFDFNIFSSKSVVDLIEQHSTTKYHSVRFGGGLPARPVPPDPPKEPTAIESKYVGQLLRAYGDDIGCMISCSSELHEHSKHSRDYLRQRARFYHAESLRNWSRDTVPDGTFESLQEEIFQGVIDICEDTHENGFRRMAATVQQSTMVTITANALVCRLQTQDRQGICHQLANEDRLKWVADND